MCDFCVSLITLTVHLVSLSVVPISLSIQFNLSMRPLVTEIRDRSPAPPNGHLTILQRAAIIKMHKEGNNQARLLTSGGGLHTCISKRLYT